MLQPKSGEWLRDFWCHPVVCCCFPHQNVVDHDSMCEYLSCKLDCGGGGTVLVKQCTAEQNAATDSISVARRKMH